MMATKIATVATIRFQKLTSNRFFFLVNDSDHIEDHGDQRHRDDEMHDDRMDDVDPGKIFVVERR